MPTELGKRTAVDVTRTSKPLLFIRVFLLLLGFLGMAGSLLNIIAFETETSGFNVLVICLSLLVAAVYLSSFGKPLIDEVGVTYFALLVVPGSVVLAVVMGAMWLELLNGVLPMKGEAVVAGKVTGKFLGGRRRPQIVVVDDRSGESTSFNVSEEEYGSLEVGSRFEKRVKVGYFGLKYQTKCW